MSLLAVVLFSCRSRMPFACPECGARFQDDVELEIHYLSRGHRVRVPARIVPQATTAGSPGAADAARDIARNVGGLAGKLRDKFAAVGQESVATASRGWQSASASVAEHASALAKLNQIHATTFKPEHETETEEEILARMEKIREESRATCIQIFEEHLEAFLIRRPRATYEEWIADLHPENAK